MRTAVIAGCSAAVLVLVGCAGRTSQPVTNNTGGASSNCPAGSERCACYGNSTCDFGLSCYSDLCVKVASGGAASTGTAVLGGSYSTSTGGYYSTSNGGSYSTGGSYSPGTGGSYSPGTGGLYSSGTGGSYSLGGSKTTGSGGTYSMGGSKSTGTGGVYSPGTGGAYSTGVGGGTRATIDPNYCNGLLANQNCGQSSAMVDVHTVNMLLVIDQSGSMRDPPTWTSAQTKWQEMATALSAALKTVAKDINFGLELFPYSGDVSAPGVDGMTTDPSVACNVPNVGDPNAAIAVDIAPGLDNLNSVLDVVRNSTPAGGTPTAMALQQAYDYFTQGNGRDQTGSKWVLLATDGGPNCNPALSCNADTCTQNIDCKCGSGCGTTLNCCAASGAQEFGYLCLDNLAVVSQINKLALAGIKTFVVGIPGSDSYTSTLNAMAEAGKMPRQSGTTSFYDVSASNSLQDLVDAFSTITTQLVRTCDIPLKSSPPDPTRIIVTIDCKTVSQVPNTTPDTGGADGFYIDYTQDPAHLRLTGNYCTTIQSLGANSLDVITGCQPIN